jgi:hypothetical protein
VIVGKDDRGPLAALLTQIVHRGPA